MADFHRTGSTNCSGCESQTRVSTRRGPSRSRCFPVDCQKFISQLFFPNWTEIVLGLFGVASITNLKNYSIL